VRALARDLGAALGTGGHLTTLRRTRVGPLTLDDAATLEDLAASFRLLDLATVARRCFPVRNLDAAEAAAVRYGRAIAVGGVGPEPVAALAPDGRLVALLAERDGRARPVLVLDPA
jgi:tRNA pseudouridine55 synthase